jgi:hypothetical protein
MSEMAVLSQSNTIYIGNTRTVAEDDLLRYCSRFGLVQQCSRRLKNEEQKRLVDFTFVQYLHEQSAKAFLTSTIHTLDQGIRLDVRPLNEILHTAVPLQIDRKIIVEHVPSFISSLDLRKYFRTFGSLRTLEETVDNDQRHVYIEFESAASKTKVMHGKIRCHRVRNCPLTIVALLRPTDVDLYANSTEK